MTSETHIIEVTDYQEHEDGSATINIVTSPDVTAMLVGLGLRTLIKRSLAEEIHEGFDALSEADDE